MMNGSEMRSPLGRAIGLGSAKEGVEHWWRQRMTAVALVPLVLWFVIALIAHLGVDQRAAVAWLGSPIPAILMILMIGVAFYHAALGIQVVVEDYVHREWCKLTLLIATRFACFFLGVVGIFAILRMAFLR
ncbi:MAG: sdhD [Rhodospirillales bacterium]|jgi:succinate dehydrogenase / fumarate reductase membrane anchor subunit|nr:sdhD [Rhodospirillales bacterium]